MKMRGDFTADYGLIRIAALALPVGALCTVVALILQRLIAFFTNVFYYQEFSIPGELISPATNTLGVWAILVPVLGGLIIGVMARFGSERIRGHGIPEALEAILIGRSRIQPKVAVLKPLSSAISIGSGGPFGAEGPIIMTGGAVGSIFGQVVHLTAAERKTLLVAGAAAGMSATFGTPLAAVLLAVELLLFEWKPRSFVPVALASGLAALLRPFVGLGQPPLFGVPLHGIMPGPEIWFAAIAMGLMAGLLSLVLSTGIYAAEDAFHRLPIHWMWWPAIGGLVVGVGGYFQPRALGVGYDIIDDVLAGHYVPQALIALGIVKCLIWTIALGSGTSGGVLAPILIMGGVLGGIASTVLPGDNRLWPLVGMAAAMGGTMRAPLTGIVFGLELTYDIRAMLPLMVAAVVSHAFTVLVLRRSILTEKVARRGYHVPCEYGVDPLDRLTLGDVMTTNVVCVPANLPIRELATEYFLAGRSKHQGYPVVDAQGQLQGVVTKTNLLDEWLATLSKESKTDGFDLGPVITYDLITRAPVTAFAWESCREAAERMAQAGVGRLPVVSPDDPNRVVGIVTRSDLLKPRARQAEEEVQRERLLFSS